MTATCPQVQELLETLCLEVSLSNENDSQCIFLLGTAPQAQLAYDVLVAHGLDARLYPENGTAKLYITKPIAADKLTAAITHAETLGDIMDAMEASGSNDYRISFANTPSLGKQISIFFPPPTTATTVAPALQTTASLTRQLPPPAQRPMTGNKHMRRRKKAAFLAAGPALAKKSLLGGKRDGDDLNLKLSGQIKNFFISNFFESFYAFLIMVFLAIFTVSIFITFKGYLCFDLATTENNAWYCSLRTLR